MTNSVKGTLKPRPLESAVDKSWLDPVTMKPVKNRPMCLPKEVNDLTFVRKFRFVVSDGNGLPEYLVRSFSVQHASDRKSHTLKLKLYEALDKSLESATQEWISQFYKVQGKGGGVRNITIEHYDGCGSLLFTETFRNIYLLSEEYGGSYDTSDVLCRELTFGYQTRIQSISEKKRSKGEISAACATPKVAKDKWTMQIGYQYWEKSRSCTNELEIKKMDKRPNVNIEEVEIPFLNTRTFLPGQAKWNPLEITVSNEVAQKVTKVLADSEESRITLYYYNKEGKRVESWMLSPIWLNRTLDTPEGRLLSFRYHHVEYKPLQRCWVRANEKRESDD